MSKISSSPTDRALEAVALAIVKKVSSPGDSISVNDLCALAEAAARIAEVDKMVSGRVLTNDVIEPRDKFTFRKRKNSTNNGGE